jgi:hypothetical protein
MNTRLPHSPAGTDKPQTTGKDAVGGHGRTAPAHSNTQPAGEPINDLLGGDARPARSYRVALQNETSDGWAAWRLAMWSMIEVGDPPVAILRDNKDNLAIFDQIAAMEHNRMMLAMKAREKELKP